MSFKIHGLSYTKEYKTWSSMKQRCYNPNAPQYKNYGARGITVCRVWQGSFVSFYKDLGPKPRGLTLERKDTNGNYEPGNCRWATWTEQNRNRRDNCILEFNGKSMPTIAWAKETGLKCQTLFSRLYRGWSIEKALTTKARKWKPRRL